MVVSRTVSADPGLLSPEELLASHKGGRRKTLEQLIAEQRSNDLRKDPKNTIFSRCRAKVQWFLDGAHLKISYDDFMTVTALYVLFGDWIRILVFPPSADSVFDMLNNISFFLFIAELIMNCWAKSDFSKGIFHVKGYMFNFFFWLDLLCIISMIPDLDWMANAFSLDSILKQDSSVGTMAGKAGKIGAKAGRVVRMARLVRLVKLYKITAQRKRERKMIEELKRLVEHGQIDENDIDIYLERMSSQKQSKVGAELSDIITRRVIVAVLLMLLVVPMLSYSSSIDEEIIATEYLYKINIDAGSGNDTLCDYLLSSTQEYKDFMGSVLNSPNESYLLQLNITPDRCEINNAFDLSNHDLSQYREEELRKIAFKSEDINSPFGVEALFTRKLLLKEEAMAGIYLTLFVVFMLVSLSTQFTGDAQKLVLAPIESMMEMVNMVADDPLEDYNFNDNAKVGDYETRVVQIAIQKITALLRLGFGVAGAEIISKNMAVEGEGCNILDPMIPGKRVYAIFGFCDIHAFDLCTEKLEDEVMTFVNIVARIVHDEVTRWGGLCNKNLGNAFLMVWRIGDESSLEDLTGRRRRKSQRNSSISSPSSSMMSGQSNRTSTRSNLAVDLRRIPGLDIVADKALIGFLRVLIEVNRDKQVLAYRSDKRLMVDSKEFLLRMGFGIHAGWAIEGAVGSLQKVDATYLSPHVNMAARMEAATRQFRVPILLTERFVELMSSQAQEHCRKLDVVTVKGSKVPMPIYTYDAFQNQVFAQLRTPKFSNLSLEQVLRKQADDYDGNIWEHDPDLIQLRRLATPEFLNTYQNGLTAYLSGSWEKAKNHFLEADRMMADNDTGGDGPSQILLSFMSSRKWQCPSDWGGYRPLTSK